MKYSLVISALVFFVVPLTANAQSHAIEPGVFKKSPAIVLEEFIYETAPYPECHASTIEETKEGLVAAWFGGTEEKDPDVCIYVSRKIDGAWTTPDQVADGIQSSDLRHPCWNPVLFNAGENKLLLFYKVGPSPRDWWGMIKTSTDCGKTWSEARRLPDHKLGPIRAKPIRLSNGRLLCGSSDESDGWIVWMESCNDDGNEWQVIGPLNKKDDFGAIQPTILRYGKDKLQILNRSRQGVLTESWSEDEGKTWSKMAKTVLPNPSSGIDAVTLKNGYQLLVYNHTKKLSRFPRSREMLNLAMSADGKSWLAAAILERQKGEHSYPAMIQTDDGLVHITYTYHRKKVKHVVVDPAKLRVAPIVNSRWPADDVPTEVPPAMASKAATQ